MQTGKKTIGHFPEGMENSFFQHLGIKEGNYPLPNFANEVTHDIGEMFWDKH